MARLLRALARGAHPPLVCRCACHRTCQGNDSFAGADPVYGLGAKAWLAAHGASITALRLDSDFGQVRGRAVAQLATLLLPLLPNLEAVSCVKLEPWTGDIDPAQMHFGVCALLRACSSLTSLQLRFGWSPDQALLERLPAPFPQHLFGRMTSLQSLHLSAEGHPESPPLVGLEEFVGVVTSLTRLHSLHLQIPTFTSSVLPACITALGELRALSLASFEHLVCAPGWAELPKLETLEIYYCGVDASGEHAFPGIDSLRNLTQLDIYDTSSLTRWPSAVWRLPRLRVLGHNVLHDDDPPPRAALPAACSQLQGLQELNLAGQGYHAFPAVITHLTALTSLCLWDNCLEVLPAGVTALASLADLAFGHRECAEPGALDVQALGRLSAFPRLEKLSLHGSAVVLSADFASAAHHPAFQFLVFQNAFAVAGLSRAAVLVYALKAREQGRCGALSVNVWVDQPGARDFWTCLEAGGLVREEFLRVD